MCLEFDFFSQQIDADDTVVQVEFVPSDGRILPKLLENNREDCFKLQTQRLRSLLKHDGYSVSDLTTVCVCMCVCAALVSLSAVQQWT